MGRRSGGPDSWSRKARSQGYAARSVFKLRDLDRRFSLLKPGARVLDLGCAPGSWLKYIGERVGKNGRVLGIDRNETVAPLPWVEVRIADLLDEGLGDELTDGFDVVTSDMAPDTTGSRVIDQARSMALAERALTLAQQALVPGGSFVAKVFQGPDVQELVARSREIFEESKLTRPKAVRKESTELFLLARRFRG